MGTTTVTLTPEQIENWRNVLLGMVGPYARIMPEADIQRFRDRMQQMADEQGDIRSLPHERVPGEMVVGEEG